MHSPELPDDATPLAIAMVLLRGDVGVGPEAVKASLARLFPEVTVDSAPDVEDTDSTFTLTSGDGADWIVSHMPGPVPAADLEGALALSGTLSEDSDALAHRTHLIVVSRGGQLTPVERRSHLSVGVAAAADASDAAAVYWGEGSVLHDVDAFVEEVKSEPVPVSLWFGVSVARPSPEDIEFLTVGLPFLAHPDLLVSAGLADAEAAFSFLYNCASYAVEHGRTLAAGESIGLSATHTLAIEAIDSPVEPDVQVLKVRYEAPR